MKKITSLALSLTMLATSVTPAMAFAPLNTRDPACIDIRELGRDKVHYFSAKRQKIMDFCACSTCKVDVLLLSTNRYHIWMC